jgi:hypothetical protein
MDLLEKEVYKVFDFFKREYQMTFSKLISDWIRDVKGNYWLLGIKSFFLTDDNYIARALKPLNSDMEMKALMNNGKVQRIKCSCCVLEFKFEAIDATTISMSEFIDLMEIDIVRESIWGQEVLKKKKIENKVPLCEVCYQLAMREKELHGMKFQLANSQFVPYKTDFDL